MADLRIPAHIVASAATITILVIALSKAAESQAMSKRRVAAALISLMFLPALVIEILTVTQWGASGFQGQLLGSKSSLGISALELQLTNALQPILPRLFILFAATIPLTLLFTPFEKPVKKFASCLSQCREPTSPARTAT